ncbi:efflux RND transporter periplasmic adaptor subunit [Acidimangrovimonas sediminis]|uniref:efflux RND transporter periplasmic adaptor subunit n=1 Tax=Acidimangrovimonas sediminis TaxID=2056283 RepID=UPI001304D0E4|nr:efflux RND transporter periplasmic adaptor subunit [Acidimangrovimonas sediminis]
MNKKDLLVTATCGALAMIGAVAVPGAAFAQQSKGAQQAAPVGVITLKKQAVPRIMTLPGRAVAYQQASITPRVGGIITKVLYTPGQKLKAGDPMFQLDQATYQATVDTDAAALAKAQAAVPTDEANYKRAVKLEGQGYTAAEVATLKASLEEDKASVQSAEAALNFAKVQLGWTTVRSPIDGYAEVPAVTVGNVVTAAQSTALTTVTRLDPIDVDVLEPSSNLLSVHKLIDNGTLTPSTKLEAKLELEDGQTYTGTGQLVTSSSTVSTTTGTVSVRFRFQNPKGQILPGMFLHAQVQLGTVQAWLVPQLATKTQTDGSLSLYIVKDGKSQAVKINADGTYKNDWIVTSGLSDGAQVIVDSLKYMGPGRPVKAVPATIGDDGQVTRQGSSDASSSDASSSAASN